MNIILGFVHTLYQGSTSNANSMLIQELEFDHLCRLTNLENLF